MNLCVPHRLSSSYIELATRRVDLVRSNRFSRRDLGWTQPARNVAWELTEIGVEARFVIRDHSVERIVAS
jgi:hypothetical protein